MISKVMTAALKGMAGVQIVAETDISRGLPAMTVVGLGDAAVKESKDRIRAAIVSSGFSYPSSRITVNLSPAHMRKRGSHFDMAIAIGILASSGQVFDRKLGDTAFIGELSLSGEVRGCDGILPMLMELKKGGIVSAVIPFDNAGEAALFGDMDVYPVRRLSEAVEVLNLKREPERGTEMVFPAETEMDATADFADVKGQEQAKRALAIAAAGGHGILMMGSPATGKTMMASRMGAIMMPMDREEIAEATAIYSVAGLLGENRRIITGRPFRCPGSGITKAGLIGGGYPPVPGEITLAHRGVLFLDEVGEFDRDVIDALRIPLEEKKVTLIRRGEKYVFPADCLLVAASNPCKCGYYGDGTDRCTCTPDEVRRYRSKLSGPILNRIDMHIYLSPVNYTDLGEGRAMSSSEMRAMVRRAWIAQRERYDGTDIRLNCGVGEGEAADFCAFDSKGDQLLRRAYDSLGLNPRTLFKVKKISRTIADMEGEEKIRSDHVAEALQYRERG